MTCPRIYLFHGSQSGWRRAQSPSSLWWDSMTSTYSTKSFNGPSPFGILRSMMHFLPTRLMPWLKYCVSVWTPTQWMPSSVMVMYETCFPLVMLYWLSPRRTYSHCFDSVMGMTLGGRLSKSLLNPAFGIYTNIYFGKFGVGDMALWSHFKTPLHLGQ